MKIRYLALLLLLAPSCSNDFFTRGGEWLVKPGIGVMASSDGYPWRSYDNAKESYDQLRSGDDRYNQYGIALKRVKDKQGLELSVSLLESECKDSSGGGSTSGNPLFMNERRLIPIKLTYTIESEMNELPLDPNFYFGVGLGVWDIEEFRTTTTSSGDIKYKRTRQIVRPHGVLGVEVGTSRRKKGLGIGVFAEVGYHSLSERFWGDKNNIGGTFAIVGVYLRF